MKSKTQTHGVNMNETKQGAMASGSNNGFVVVIRMQLFRF